MKNTHIWSRGDLAIQAGRRQLDLALEIHQFHLITIVLLLTTVAFMGQSFAQDSVQRPNEMEFDARVIQGQRAEGAVYLFQRATRALPPLLKYKRDYLTAIVSPVFSQDTALGQKLSAKAKKGNLKIGKQTQSTAPKSVKPVEESTNSQSRKKRKKSRKTWRKSRRKPKAMRRGRK